MNNKTQTENTRSIIEAGDGAILFLHSLIHRNLSQTVKYADQADVGLDTLIDILTDIYNDEETE